MLAARVHFRDPIGFEFPFEVLETRRGVGKGSQLALGEAGGCVGPAQLEAKGAGGDIERDEKSDGMKAGRWLGPVQSLVKVKLLHT